MNRELTSETANETITLLPGLKEAEILQLGRPGVCVLTDDGLILTEAEARFRELAGQGRDFGPVHPVSALGLI